MNSLYRPLLHSMIFGIFLVFNLISFKTQALPDDVHNYQVSYGGLVDIENGAYIEGSLSYGGIQPDYKIDLESEPLKSLLSKCKIIESLKISFWEKIRMVQNLLTSDFFKYRDYYNPSYRRLLKKYRQAGRDIPLSEYGACSAGVCREYALVQHFALKAAGIKNKHIYAHIYRAHKGENYELTEDHAFNIVEHEGIQWSVDAYSKGFNGYQLNDLLSPEGITHQSARAPIAVTYDEIRYIVKINQFPKIYHPPLSPQCTQIFK